MEVDALTWQKGKGKWPKGKGKGKGDYAQPKGKGKKGYDGKGKQHDRFEGACFNCGKPGHRASECRSSPSSTVPKGKSRGKGKGKTGNCAFS